MLPNGPPKTMFRAIAIPHIKFRSFISEDVKQRTSSSERNEHHECKEGVHDFSDLISRLDQVKEINGEAFQKDV